MPLFLSLPLIALGTWFVGATLLSWFGWLGTLAAVLWAIAALSLAYHVRIVQLVRLTTLRRAIDALTVGVRSAPRGLGPLERIEALYGQDHVKERISAILDIVGRAPDRRRAFDTASIATVFIIHGPSGTGKHTLGFAFADLMIDIGVFDRGKVVTVPADVFAYLEPSRIVEQTALLVRQAQNGILVLEHAEWLVQDAERGVAFGRGLLRAIRDGAGQPFVCVIGSDRLYQELAENSALQQAWLDRCHIENLPFLDIEPDYLVALFEGLCREHHVQLDPVVRQRLPELIAKLESRSDGRFSHAMTVRRWFDYLVSMARNRLGGGVPIVIDEQDLDMPDPIWRTFS